MFTSPADYFLYSFIKLRLVRVKMWFHYNFGVNLRSGWSKEFFCTGKCYFQCDFMGLGAHFPGPWSTPKLVFDDHVHFDPIMKLEDYWAPKTIDRHTVKFTGVILVVLSIQNGHFFPENFAWSIALVTSALGPRASPLVAGAALAPTASAGAAAAWWEGELMDPSQSVCRTAQTKVRHDKKTPSPSSHFMIFDTKYVRPAVDI